MLPVRLPSVDKAALLDHHQQYAFDNLDFNFTEHGFWADGLCVMVRNLPAYDIAEVRTGQYILGQDVLWAIEFNFATAQSECCRMCLYPT